MTQEAAKTNRLRGEAFLAEYCHGRVIDIGCGDDLVVPHAEPFDFFHGDAEQILNYRPAESYDCVHSSHCLEHMRDVPQALAGWWALVKPGGHLVVVVPDEELYEQGYWPSKFNRDHKATFRLSGSVAQSPISYAINELVSALPNYQIVSIERHDAQYDYSLLKRRANRLGNRLYKLEYKSPWRWLKNIFHTMLLKYGFDNGEYPLDQTRGDALAQIQCILKKV